MSIAGPQTQVTCQIQAQSDDSCPAGGISELQPDLVKEPAQAVCSGVLKGQGPLPAFLSFQNPMPRSHAFQALAVCPSVLHSFPFSLLPYPSSHQSTPRNIKNSEVSLIRNWIKPAA